MGCTTDIAPTITVSVSEVQCDLVAHCCTVACTEGYSANPPSLPPSGRTTSSPSLYTFKRFGRPVSAQREKSCQVMPACAKMPLTLVPAEHAISCAMKAPAELPTKITSLSSAPWLCTAESMRLLRKATSSTSMLCKLQQASVALQKRSPSLSCIPSGHMRRNCSESTRLTMS